MKAISTIRKQIARLSKISKDENNHPDVKRVAYETYHALRWVIEDVSWTPATLLERTAAETAKTEIPAT